MGGRSVRGCRSKRIRTELKSITSLITLTVQPKPILSRSDCAIAGKIMPPVAAPLAWREMAMARFFVKYVEMRAIMGQKRRPHPMPEQMP